MKYNPRRTRSKAKAKKGQRDETEMLHSLRERLQVMDEEDLKATQEYRKDIKGIIEAPEDSTASVNLMDAPRAREQVPPPLLPPCHLEKPRAGQDSSLQWGNTSSPRDTGFSGKLAIDKLDVSLYGRSDGDAH